MKFAQRVVEERRLAILRLLATSIYHSANETLLFMALGDFRPRFSHDDLDADLRWMEEQKVVMVEEIAGIKIATATTLGLDVAAGRATAAGIAERQ